LSAIQVSDLGLLKWMVSQGWNPVGHLEQVILIAVEIGFHQSVRFLFDLLVAEEA
jgi:hypothetical protein